MPKRRYSKKRSTFKKRRYSKKSSKKSYKKRSFKKRSYKKKPGAFYKRPVYRAKGRRLLAAPMMGANRAHMRLISKGNQVQINHTLLDVMYFPIAANRPTVPFSTSLPTGATQPWNCTICPDNTLPAGYFASPAGHSDMVTTWQKYICTGGSCTVEFTRMDHADDAVIQLGLLPISRDAYSKLVVPATYTNAQYWPILGTFTTAQSQQSWTAFVDQPGVVKGSVGSVYGGKRSSTCKMRASFKTSALSDQMGYYTDSGWYYDAGAAATNVLYYLIGIYADGGGVASNVYDMKVTLMWDVTCLKPRLASNFPMALQNNVPTSESKEEKKLDPDDDDMDLETQMVKLSTSSPPSIHVTGPPPDGKPVLASPSIPAPALIPPHSKMLGRPAKKG